MNPGDLRRRITIQQPSETKDSEGIVTVTWVDLATVWAAVEPLQGREFLSAQAVTSEPITRIRIRYQAGIKPSMRAVYGTRIYDIQYVIDTGDRHRELQLMCREVTDGGGY